MSTLQSYSCTSRTYRDAVIGHPAECGIYRPVDFASTVYSQRDSTLPICFMFLYLPPSLYLSVYTHIIYYDDDYYEPFVVCVTTAFVVVYMSALSRRTARITLVPYVILFY